MTPSETTQQLIPVAEAVEEVVFDDYNDTGYSDDLYRAAGVAAGVDGLDAIGDEQAALFREQGYLVVDQAFTADEIHTALDGLLDLIDGKNPAFKGIQFELRARDVLGTLSREQKQDYVRKLIYYVEYDPRLKALSGHPRLLAAVTRLLGVAPTLYADQALLKPPLIGREKPWHQDKAFFNLPIATPIVGVWIALDEATTENGCMHVIPGTHREPTIHFRRRDWQICDTDVAVDRVLAVPLRPGGCLFFDGLIHHGTPATHSPRRRRALQFHYMPAGVERTGPEERLAIFGSEGKDVTC